MAAQAKLILALLRDIDMVDDESLPVRHLEPVAVAAKPFVLMAVRAVDLVGADQFAMGGHKIRRMGKGEPVAFKTRVGAGLRAVARTAVKERPASEHDVGLLPEIRGPVRTGRQAGDVSRVAHAARERGAFAVVAVETILHSGEGGPGGPFGMADPAMAVDAVPGVGFGLTMAHSDTVRGHDRLPYNLLVAF